jgi:hypothetical protein
MIDIKMKRYDLSVAVKCSSTDEMYRMNMDGFLPALEQFLGALEDFDIVHVEINTPKVEDPFSLDSIDENEITITNTYYPDTDYLDVHTV